MKTLMIMVALGMALGMGWWARGRAAIPTPRRVATVTAAPAPVRVAVARSPEENLAEIRSLYVEEEHRHHTHSTGLPGNLTKLLNPRGLTE